jgi:copper homeostasis protein
VSILLEACVDTVDSAVAAESAGAGRVELCAGLVEGGTTPSAGLIAEVRERTSLPVFVMVRPRGGDFVYGAPDRAVMLRDVAAARAAGAHGIVSGALRRDGAIDEGLTGALVEAAAPLPFTFHRAFDLTPDLSAALDALCAQGVARVLTSGGAERALAGADRIAALVRQSAGRLAILAGGGVRARHAAELVRRTGVGEVHARPTRPVSSPGRLLVTAAAGAAPLELDPVAVRALADALAAIGSA